MLPCSMQTRSHESHRDENRDKDADKSMYGYVGVTQRDEHKIINCGASNERLRHDVSTTARILQMLQDSDQNRANATKTAVPQTST